jgi:hypothetical protein
LGREELINSEGVSIYFFVFFVNGNKAHYSGVECNFFQLLAIYPMCRVVAKLFYKYIDG